MKFKPLYDKILVKRVEQEQKTAGGILIPDSAQEKPLIGDIVAVGNGCITDSGQLRSLSVKQGDRVYFSKYAGTEIKIDADEYLIIKESDILGILE